MNEQIISELTSAIHIVFWGAFLLGILGGVMLRDICNPIVMATTKFIYRRFYKAIETPTPEKKTRKPRKKKQQELALGGDA